MSVSNNETRLRPANHPGRPRMGRDYLDRMLLPYQADSIRATRKEIARLRASLNGLPNRASEDAVRLQVTIELLVGFLMTAKREWGLLPGDE